MRGPIPWKETQACTGYKKKQTPNCSYATGCFLVAVLAEKYQQTLRFDLCKIVWRGIGPESGARDNCAFPPNRAVKEIHLCARAGSRKRRSLRSFASRMPEHRSANSLASTAFAQIPIRLWKSKYAGMDVADVVRLKNSKPKTRRCTASSPNSRSRSMRWIT